MMEEVGKCVLGGNKENLILWEEEHRRRDRTDCSSLYP